eukprot:scaffold68028_cov27-Tisochrysis_lutea.AAC.3
MQDATTSYQSARLCVRALPTVPCHRSLTAAIPPLLRHRRAAASHASWSLCQSLANTSGRRRLALRAPISCSDRQPSGQLLPIGTASRPMSAGPPCSSPPATAPPAVRRAPRALRLRPPLRDRIASRVRSSRARLR